MMPFAVISRSDTDPVEALPRLERAAGAARITFRHRHGATRLDRLHQSGASKIRLPRVPVDEPPQAVLINTAGGLTGGDRISTEVDVGAGCRAVLTSQACERIYRARDGAAELSTRLVVSEGGRLDWLPQETILYDGAHLTRRVDADLAEGAELLMLEAVIFGRAAHGETVRAGRLADRWRIRRQGRLLFADDLRFDWADASLLSRPAVLADGGAMATLLFVTEEPDRRLDGLRRAIGESGGASAWNGRLVARIAAESGAALRRALVPAIAHLLDRTTLPKIWQT